MNIVRNSLKKKMEDYFVKYNLNNAEILDVFVVLVRAFSVEIDMLKEKGVEVVTIPKSLKRHDFSQLPESLHRNHKERLLAIFNQYLDAVICDAFFKVLTKNVLSAECLKVLHNSCGISISASSLSATARLDLSIDESGVGIAEVGSTTPKSKLVKVTAMANTIKESSISVSDRGCVKSLAKTFKVNEKFAKNVVENAHDKTPTKIVQRAKIKTIHETEWPEIIKAFCFTKPICREAEGESVSVKYGVRAEKYIRQFSIQEIFNFFRIKHPDFDYQLSTFRTLVPKNLVPATLRDVKRNTCPIHENVKRCIKALNRFFRKHNAPELVLPKSMLDVSLKLICNPYPENEQMNRDPLNWHLNCTQLSQL